MPNNYLIYHPPRIRSEINNFVIYHDSLKGNEDPYIWNKNFLHTFCHITQLKNEVGQINFWVSGNCYPNFTKLFCDCIFVIKSKHFWSNRNSISNIDPIVDNLQTFKHHYNWVNVPNFSHKFSRRRRYTLKADENTSFQPQNRIKELIDILPFLNNEGLETKELIKSMTSGKNSKPYRLPSNMSKKLYDFISKESYYKVRGSDIMHLHP